MSQTTYMANPEKITRKCYVIDAADKTLGKIATKAASVLRGKHKAIYTPHVDTGDQVIIINAEKVRVTGKKYKDKEYQYYTGFHGGRRGGGFEEVIATRPAEGVQVGGTRGL